MYVVSTYCSTFEMIYVPHFCYVYLRAQKVFARLSYIIIDQLFQALFFFGKSFPFQFPIALLNKYTIVYFNCRLYANLDTNSQTNLELAILLTQDFLIIDQN